MNSLTQIAGITRVQFLIDGVIFDGAVEGTRIDGMFEKNMALVYRPESKAPESLIELPKSDDALKKDIEQQLKENGVAQKQIPAFFLILDFIEPAADIFFQRYCPLLCGHSPTKSDNQKNRQSQNIFPGTVCPKF